MTGAAEVVLVCATKGSRRRKAHCRKQPEHVRVPALGQPG